MYNHSKKISSFPFWQYGITSEPTRGMAKIAFTHVGANMDKHKVDSRQLVSCSDIIFDRFSQPTEITVSVPTF